MEAYNSMYLAQDERKGHMNRSSYHIPKPYPSFYPLEREQAKGKTEEKVVCVRTLNKEGSTEAQYLGLDILQK